MKAQAPATERQEIPASRSVRNGATRSVASAFGVFAGLIGMEHGYFETPQGNVAPGGISILAIGPPCQGNTVWHGCEPAMTIVPNFFVTGILAMIVSLILLLWAAAFVQKKYGGLVLILLSIPLLLVGGGFVPIPLVIVAGVVGTRINAPLTWWRARLSAHVRSFLAQLWPWSLIATFVWIPVQFIFGTFFGVENSNLPLMLGYPLLLLGLILLTILTAFAHDIQMQDALYERRPLT